MKNIAFVFIVFVLVSSIFIPSINFAYASPVPNLIASGDTIHATIDGETLGGGLTIEAGGELIVDSGVTLNINGGMVNDGKITIIDNDGVLFVKGLTVNSITGEIIIDGVLSSTGPVINTGEIFLRCGDLFGNVIGSGLFDDTSLPCEDGSNIIEIVDDIGIDETLIISSGDIGKISADATITISGTLVNNGDIENRGQIILDGATIQNIGTITNFCTNFDNKGITGSGSVSPNSAVDDPIECIPPVADDDVYDAIEDVPLSVPPPAVLDGDTDDGNLLTASFVSKLVGEGSVDMNNDGSFTYTPDDDFFGTFQFEYQAIDEDGGQDNAIVTIEVAPVNDAPIANDQDSVTTSEDTPKDITLTGSDIDSEIMSYAIEDGPLNGSLSGIDGSDVTYTPNENFFGIDSFTFTVTDEASSISLPGTITIDISEINDKPKITLIGDTSIFLKEGDTYDEQSATCSDIEDGDISGNMAIGGLLDGTVVDEGVYQVTYDCKDTPGLDADQVIRIVDVRSNDDPEIIVNGNDSIEIILGDEYTDAGATYSDTENGTGPVVEGGLVDGNGVTTDIVNNVNSASVGTYTVDYSVIDSDGNESTEFRSVEVVDPGNFPEIDITDTNTVTINLGDEYTDAGATYSDTENGTGPVVEGGLVDGNGVTTDIVNNVNSASVGTYTVDYSVIDSDGNESTESRIVYVVDEFSNSLRDQKINEIMELEDLIDESTDKKTVNEINKSLKELNKSIETEKWEDNGNYLIDNKGKKVFDEEQKGVKHMMKILDKDNESNEFLSKISSIIFNLVDIDEQLAGLEYANAVESGAEEKCLDQADKETKKVEKEEGKGKYDKAVDHLGHLWEKSLKCQ